MASTRAPAVAEVLWELKRLDKVARYSVIAARAGFNPGAKGRAMQVCLDSIRKEWPHLQVWRAIRDDGTTVGNSSQYRELKTWGASFSEPGEEGRVGLLIDEARVMVWDDETLPLDEPDPAVPRQP